MRVVRQAEDVINAHIVKESELYQHIGWEIALPLLIV